MWCPSDLAYTIKEYIVGGDAHLTLFIQLQSAFFDVMTIFPIVHN